MGNTESKLNPKDIDDLMRMTEFNGDELNNIFHKFRKNNNSNYLDKTEFVHKFSNIFTASDGVDFADHVFRVYDVNQDGLINFREFVIGLSLTYKAPLEDKLYSIFKLYDINGNGDISREEMENIMKSLYKFTKRNNPDTSSDEAFRTLDSNRDGRITWGEFRKGLLNNKELVKLIEL